MARESFHLIIVGLSVLFIRCSQGGQSLGSHPQISVEFLEYSEDATVGSMVVDRWIPGNILISIGNCLSTISKSGRTSLVAGTDCGYRSYKSDKNDSDKFLGISQLGNGYATVFADYGGSCLHRFDRLSGNTSTFPKSCENRGNCTRKRDGAKPTFCRISVLRTSNERNKVYLLDEWNDFVSVRVVNFDISAVTTIFESQNLDIKDFLIDNYTRITFLTPGGIFQFDTLTQQIKWLFGGESMMMFGNSPLDKSKQNLAMAGKDGLFVVSNRMNDRVFLLDSNTGNISFICSNLSSQACQLKQPSSVAILDNYLYIGVASADIRTQFDWDLTSRLSIVSIALTDTAENDVSFDSEESDESYHLMIRHVGGADMIMMICVMLVLLYILYCIYRMCKKSKVYAQSMVEEDEPKQDVDLLLDKKLLAVDDNLAPVHTSSKLQLVMELENVPVDLTVDDDATDDSSPLLINY